VNFQRILVRAARTYVQTLAGLIPLTTTGVLSRSEFEGILGSVVLALLTALAPAVVSLLQNLAEELGHVEGTVRG
jgi:hypothetical protein